MQAPRVDLTNNITDLIAVKPRLKISMYVLKMRTTNQVYFSLATKPTRYKCGLYKPCPDDHFSFKMASGAASIVGPKICLEDDT